MASTSPPPGTQRDQRRRRGDEDHAGHDHPHRHASHEALSADSTASVETQVRSNGHHHGGMVADYRRRFWISLILTVPVLALSPTIQGFLGLGDRFAFAGADVVSFVLSSVIFFYGSLQDAAVFLDAHGIAAESMVIDTKNLPPAEQIVAFATGAGAGLIVSGAYGHTRIREWVFGGVTRELTNHCPIPCLFSR